MFKFLKRLFRHRCRKWDQRTLVSADGQTFYRVRKCRACGLEQIQDFLGLWNDIKTFKFSIMPCFEEHHRKQFESARETL